MSHADAVTRSTSGAGCRLLTLVRPQILADGRCSSSAALLSSVQPPLWKAGRHICPALHTLHVNHEHVIVMCPAAGYRPLTRSYRRALSPYKAPRGMTASPLRRHSSAGSTGGLPTARAPLPQTIACQAYCRRRRLCPPSPTRAVIQLTWVSWSCCMLMPVPKAVCMGHCSVGYVGPVLLNHFRCDVMTGLNCKCDASCCRRGHRAAGAGSVCQGCRGALLPFQSPRSPFHSPPQAFSRCAAWP